MVNLESLSGLQQTALQHCQDTIAGLEETVAQLVMSVKKLEKMVCQCHDWLLSPGPHFMPREEEEMIEEEEEEEEESGLEYKTDTPFKDSYTTPPSTGGHSKLSPAASHSPTLEDSDPENNMVLRTEELEACIEVFLEEAKEDMKMSDLPPLENISPLPVISCLSWQYSGLYLSPTLPTLLLASNIPDRCIIGCLLHNYRNPPPTDYFHIFPTIRSILRP